ncbi:MAG: Re/Si-specific NAD(P)(+) transhydrogenase subunit alpha [Phycisphaeraceae bacterium]
MKLAVPNQSGQGETRVALSVQAVKKLVSKGVQVVVESGAGAAALMTDQAYRDVGATVVDQQGEATPQVWAEADVVAVIPPPTQAQAEQMKAGSVLIGMLAPLQNQDLIRTLLDRKVTAISLEFIPRISRAQAMDVLSSQANIAGYKAVLMAADRSPKLFPMMITAAGTIAPARTFVIGAGVAGLQAIATAKRLGAIVEAFDVRAVTKEQVQSLGARFVELPTAAQDDKETGGYAKEQSEEEQKKQAELMAKHVTGADVVITTAAVFGKAPPMLIPADVVAGMKPCAVLVDLAADPRSGRGNCELTRPGEVVTTEQGVTLIGTLNLPGLVPGDASAVYANNILNLLNELIVEQAIKIDPSDEIQKGAVIAHDGQLVNEFVKQNMQG